MVPTSITLLPPSRPLNFSDSTAFLIQKRAETTAVPDTNTSGLTITEPALSSTRAESPDQSATTLTMSFTFTSVVSQEPFRTKVFTRELPPSSSSVRHNLPPDFSALTTLCLPSLEISALDFLGLSSGLTGVVENGESSRQANRSSSSSQGILTGVFN